MLTDRKDAVIKVLVVDDHPVVVGGVRTLLARDPTIVVAGDASSASQGIAKAEQLQPHVVLLDLRLPGSDVNATVAELRAAAPAAKIVVFTAYGNPAAMAQAFGARVDGFLLKDVSDYDIAELLRSVVAGESSFRSRRPRDDEQFLPPLTRREIEVLRCTAMGHTNPEIAKDLLLSRNTVKTYLQSAMQKLGARNRVEAISRANEAGLL